MAKKKEIKKSDVTLEKQETIEVDGEKKIKLTYSNGREQIFGL